MIAGLIYAGGQAARLGGVDKALLPLAGAPLVGWVAERLRPQVDALAISARGDPDRFAFLRCAVLPDPVEAGTAQWGPAAGLLSGLWWAKTIGADWLVTAPTDAPFLPEDLVHQLTQAEAKAAVVCRSSGLEPAFAAFRVDHGDVIENAIRNGEHALYRLTGLLNARILRAQEADPPPWFNINLPDDVVAAEAIVARYGLRPPQFPAL
jgi:molybdopterin-guanine dinucleotide biosynthesis protein A